MRLGNDLQLFRGRQTRGGKTSLVKKVTPLKFLQELSSLQWCEMYIAFPEKENKEEKRFGDGASKGHNKTGETIGWACAKPISAIAEK